MTSHGVKLPYPKREGGGVTGACDCGWSTTYKWGQYGDAKRSAVEHIAEASGSEAIEISTFAGETGYVEGGSL